MAPSSVLSPRLPRSGNAALASAAMLQMVLGTEFVLAGINKAVDSDYAAQFRGFVQGSSGASSGPLSELIQTLVVPNLDQVAQLSKATELGAGAILILTGLEVLRRRLSGAFGAQHGYEPLLALVSSAAAFALAGMSLTIYYLEGGRFPMINPGFAFTSPIAVELLLVPFALGIEFVLAGINKAVDSDYAAQFRGFVQGSPGASSGPLAGLIQTLVVPNVDLVAQLSKATELGAGAILILTGLDVLRRRLSGAFGAQHGYEPLLALVSSLAAMALGGVSLTIYYLDGGRFPMINPGFAFTSPIAVELLLVPFALGIASVELARFFALRGARGQGAPASL